MRRCWFGHRWRDIGVSARDKAVEGRAWQYIIRTRRYRCDRCGTECDRVKP